MKKREFHEIELTIISMEEEDVIRTSAGGDVVAPGIGDFDSTNN